MTTFMSDTDSINIIKSNICFKTSTGTSIDLVFGDFYEIFRLFRDFRRFRRFRGIGLAETLVTNAYNAHKMNLEISVTDYMEEKNEVEMNF